MSLGGLPPDPIPTATADPSSVLAFVAGTLQTQGAVTLGMLPAGKPRSSFRRGLEVFLENKLAVTGVGIFVFFLLFCFLWPHLYLRLGIRPPETEWGLMLANGTQ